MIKSFSLKITLLLIISCYFINSYASSDTLKYVFIGHPYSWAANNKVDSVVEHMDTSEFDGIWLGGDVCSEASLFKPTIEYLDETFNLSKPTNHWTLGNHDTRNYSLEWIEEHTKRPTFYGHSSQGLTVVVLDGSISPLDCEKKNQQFALIKNVCDTITTGHLIFLIHHGITVDVPGVTPPNVYGHSLHRNWLANCDDENASYADAIYPMLVDVESKGVQVYHVMGDVGANRKSFYEQSTDGIDYFGSGINNSYNIQFGIPIEEEDLVLIFKHIPSENKLLWEFVELNSLKSYDD